MTLEISSNRRAEIKKHVLGTLQNYGQPHVPVKIGNIIRQMHNVKLITYSSQIKKHNITYDELIVDAETKDSYAVWNSTSDRYCIYYNDIDYNIVSSNRVRWNLAHELGHIVLEHHKSCKHHKLFRDGLASSIYDYLEEEANYFAQLILVPHVVLYSFKIKNANQLKTLCKISGPAANRRFYAYQMWINHMHENIEYDKPLFYYYHDFIFKKHCATCGAQFILEKGKYCPICGNKTLQWGDGNMIYKKLPATDTGKLLECPICKNEETNLEGTYCQICGVELVNHCSNPECNSTDPLPTNARHCPICGWEATFLHLGILNEWDYQEPVDDYIDVPYEELPFN